MDQCEGLSGSVQVPKKSPLSASAPRSASDPTPDPHFFMANMGLNHPGLYYCQKWKSYMPARMV